MFKIEDQIVELNQNYHELGKVLLLLGVVVLTVQGENDLPQEYIASSISRMIGCINQHTEDIRFFAELLQKATSPAPGEL